MPLQAAAIPKRNISFWNALLMVRAVHLRVLPETRGECRGGARPCPMVSCRHHLLLDVASDGRLYRTMPFDERSPESILEALVAMPETCALDVADRGGVSDIKAAEVLNLDRSWLIDIEDAALRKLEVFGAHLREHPEDSYLRYMNMSKEELTMEAQKLGKRRR
jgi:hypothetical protein